MITVDYMGRGLAVDYGIKNSFLPSRIIPVRHFFPSPGMCSLFARANMLYRRLADDELEIFVRFTY